MPLRTLTASTLVSLLCPLALAAASEIVTPPRAILRPAPVATYFDISPPLREMVAAAAATASGTAGEESAPLDLGFDFAVGDAPHPGDAALQGAAGITTMPVPSLGFDAIPNTNVNPPSPSADVGRNHYVVMANVRTMIFNKSGTAVLGPFNNNVIWAGFGGPCESTNPGQPIVLYDQIADRWLLSQALSTGPYALCIAVSVTNDPTGSYYRWSFPTGGGDNFPDAPKYAVWPDAYYVGTREFVGVGPFAGIGAYALNRADLLAGVPAPRVVSFLVPPDTPSDIGDGLLPADLDGSRLPPPGSPCTFVGSMDQGGPYGAIQDALTVWRFHADFDVPANSSFTKVATLPVSIFDSAFPCPGANRRCIPQPGVTTTQYLDVQSYRQRLMNRVVYRNFGTHESIVGNQTVEATAGMAGIRWYELRDPGGTPVVHQQGTYAPADMIHRWNGSLAMDHMGNMALGFSVSSTTVFPAIRYTGRLAGDPLDTMPQGEGVFVNGGGAQTTTNNRWGDYSSMNVDPGDDCTFWYVNEYYPITSPTGWLLRVGAFKYPGCIAAVGIEEDAPASATRLGPIGLGRGPVEVRFTLAGSAVRPVRIDVLDVSGRRVRRLVEGAYGGGQFQVTWDRTSDAGARLASGVYHVRLRAGDEQDSEGVVLLK